MARACLCGPWHLLFCGALKSPARRGSGWSWLVPCWPSPRRSPPVTLGLSPQMCPGRSPTAAPGARRAVLLLPKGRCTSLHPNNYLSLGALTNSQESLPAAAIAPAAGQPSVLVSVTAALSPGLWYRDGERLLLCSQTSSLRCCSVHSPQGNQTLRIFW